jgi:hypothetical protein
MTRHELLPAARFIEKNYAPAAIWRDDALLDWICWAASEGFFIQVLDNNESMVGIAIARTVNNIPGDNTSEFDRNGKIIFIDLAIAPDKQIKQALGFAMLEMFGQRPILAYKVDGKTKVHDTAKVRAALFKMRN